MKFTLLLCALLLSFSSVSEAQDSDWKSLFNGASLEGWDGNPKFWTVEDGAITGTTTKENPTKGNTFIIYTADNADFIPVEFGDFELKLKFRIKAHNSGIQYRSIKLKDSEDRWRVGGYQSDFDASGHWVGTNFSEKFRGILAERGKKSVITGVKEVVRNNRKRFFAVRETTDIGDAKELGKHVKAYPEWNEMLIIAKGNPLIQKVNGVVMSEVIDNDKEHRRDKGLIAVQLHSGPPMEVQVKEVYVKQ